MILHINCCTRKDSRTKALADALIKKLSGNVEEVRLYEENLSPMTEKALEKRTKLASKRDFSDEMFRYARQFAGADEIVVSAPFWDLSFPAVLKLYIENIYVTGLVSEFDEKGFPRGLCKAKKLHYVVTSGGPFNPKYSFDYFKELCQNFLGIKEVQVVKAENLDIFGNDSGKILEKAISEIEA